jgi:hypothetical protein
VKVSHQVLLVVVYWIVCGFVFGLAVLWPDWQRVFSMAGLFGSIGLGVAAWLDQPSEEERSSDLIWGCFLFYLPLVFYAWGLVWGIWRLLSRR